MTTDELHEVTFIWPRTNAQSVVLTGTFDNWSKSICLTRSQNGFTGSIKIPWNETIAYKYIVDGNWSLDDSKPKRIELGGYVNNVYVAPSKPPSPEEATVKAPPEVHLNGTINGVKTEYISDARAVQNVSEVAEKIPDGLQPKINSHLAMSEPPRDTSSVQEGNNKGDPSVKEGMKSILVDGHSADGDNTAMADKEEGIQNPKEDGKPGLVPEPIEETVEIASPSGLTSPRTEQEVSQVASDSSPTPIVPEERKRSTIMPFVPVNVPPEAPVVDSSLQNGTSGEETSTHKPLGLVSKASQLPTATSEGAASHAESAAKQTISQIPVQSDGVIAEAGPLHGAAEGNFAAEPEEKAAAPAPSTQVPQSTLTEGSQRDVARPIEPEAEDKPSNVLSTASPGTTPLKGAEVSTDTTKTPVFAAVAAAPVPTEAKPAGKSPSAPSSPTKAKFPRFSRESSASEPPQKGNALKRKSTIIEKIKHIFSHEKEKGKGKNKK